MEVKPSVYNSIRPRNVIFRGFGCRVPWGEQIWEQRDTFVKKSELVSFQCQFMNQASISGSQSEEFQESRLQFQIRSAQ